jgi:hypothetical protein
MNTPTTGQHRRRGLFRTVAAAIATAMVVLVGLAGAAPVSAASSIGGSIARSEILQRAEAWYHLCSTPSDCSANGMTYDMNGTHIDPTGSRSYRRDCSGFVYMACHMGTDPNTGGLDSSTYTTRISRSSLMPGDILDDDVVSAGDGGNYPYHTVLFGGWEDSAKTTFWYYSFGGTPIKKVTGFKFSTSTLSGHPTADYKALRYNKIAAESWPKMTTICDYKVVTSVTERSGPGTAYPYEPGAALLAGNHVGAGENGTVMNGTTVWRHIADSLGADGSGGWVPATDLAWVNAGTCLS